MINIAIVEDNIEASKLLQAYITKYTLKHGINFKIKTFSNAVTFLAEFRKLYDVIFMDIEMPNLNGMDAALKLREFDKQAVLIFVTNMAKFAVKGYEADALDFMVKPINYHDFALKLEKAIKIVNSNSETELVISQASGFIRLPIRSIIYIEVMGHKINYHTEKEVYTCSGSLSDLETKLKSFHFMRCKSCYLVNPKYVASVNGYDLTMKNGDVLKISYPKKKAFMSELAEWLGQGNFL